MEIAPEVMELKLLDTTCSVVDVAVNITQSTTYVTQEWASQIGQIWQCPNKNNSPAYRPEPVTCLLYFMRKKILLVIEGIVCVILFFFPLLRKISSDSENSLFTVTLFKKVVDEYKLHARENKLVWWNNIR